MILVFVSSEHTDRGVPYGAGIAVWRGFFFISGDSFSTNSAHGARHCPPGWETGAAEGNKGLFAQSFCVSASQTHLEWKYECLPRASSAAETIQE